MFNQNQILSGIALAIQSLTEAVNAQTEEIKLLNRNLHGGKSFLEFTPLAVESEPAPPACKLQAENPKADIPQAENQTGAESAKPAVAIPPGEPKTIKEKLRAKKALGLISPDPNKNTRAKAVLAEIRKAEPLSSDFEPPEQIPVEKSAGAASKAECAAKAELAESVENKRENPLEPLPFRSEECTEEALKTRRKDFNQMIYSWLLKAVIWDKGKVQRVFESCGDAHRPSDISDAVFKDFIVKLEKMREEA